jgi:hypothetical protein
MIVLRSVVMVRLVDERRDGRWTATVKKMRYLLLISANEDVAEKTSSDEGLAAFGAWLADLQSRGVLRAHEGLHPSQTATTVRVRDGEVLLTDGPFIEGKEQVGGLALVECAGLDEAIEIAAGHPATAIGQVEIRPVRQA